ncbi:hypothetical protein CSUI_006603 [Cystoisospora suis]|uniref:Uncharacterized protein n=1 Tax=Cystoisospora suis TaxID=483139 RepID=A0A2C6KR71_9APIC|nr:hypothetical protein CSUI_006603 [Cystoisospora suis]
MCLNMRESQSIRHLSGDRHHGNLGWKSVWRKKSFRATFLFVVIDCQLGKHIKILLQKCEGVHYQNGRKRERNKHGVTLTSPCCLKSPPLKLLIRSLMALMA